MEAILKQMRQKILNISSFTFVHLMSTIFYYRYLIKLILMEVPIIAISHSNCQTDGKDSTFIQSKLLDSISNLENSSQICVSKLHVEFQNSQINSQLKEKPIQSCSQNLDQSIKNDLIQNEQMSQESDGQEIPNIAKSGREQKFKRSTNNSHKKFISVARRWLFKNNKSQLKFAFENKFNAFRSTRTYFFIILAFIRAIMSEQKQKQFQSHFTKEVSTKIVQYEKQIENTLNENLKHFRTDQITDLKFSIKACEVYFQGDIDKSIECVYKKDKSSIVKKHHYQEALKTVKTIELEFHNPNFIDDTISLFGGKKPRNKTIHNQTFINTDNNSLLNSKSQCRFLYPQMFGLKTVFPYESIKVSNKQKPIRLTMECEQEQQKNQSMKIQDEGVNISVQNQGQLSIQKKKTINVFVIGPNTKVNENQMTMESLNEMQLNNGFRPYKRQ